MKKRFILAIVLALLSLTGTKTFAQSRYCSSTNTWIVGTCPNGPATATLPTGSGTLPLATAVPVGTSYNITNGNSSSDCATGGGTNIVTCTTNGSSWSASSAGGATTNQNYREVSAFFDGGGSALSGTVQACRVVSYAGTINSFTVAADQSGSATIKVLTVAFASYTGIGSASDITGGGESLSSAVTKQDTSLSGWTTAFSANTMVCIQVTSPSTVTQLAVTVRISAS
jgi:hypothetical protein